MHAHGKRSVTQPVASDPSDDQLDAPETVLSPQEAQRLAGTNRMARANGRSATEAAARKRTERAMPQDLRLEKRRADQQARRKAQRDAVVSSGGAATATATANTGAGAKAAGEAAVRKLEHKAARAAKARNHYEEQQRQKRVKQHERELPERQALVDQMREICMEMIRGYSVRASAHADRSHS
jgi:hypothetical protein